MTLLLATEPAGDAALGLGRALLDLTVCGIDLLAGILAVLLELALGIGHFLLGLVSRTVDLCANIGTPFLISQGSPDLYISTTIALPPSDIYRHPSKEP